MKKTANFHHLRNLMNDGRFYSKGGATIAMYTDESHIYYGVGVCILPDNFNRKLGRSEAANRLGFILTNEGKEDIATQLVEEILTSEKKEYDKYTAKLQDRIKRITKNLEEKSHARKMKTFSKKASLIEELNKRKFLPKKFDSNSMKLLTGKISVREIKEARLIRQIKSKLLSNEYNLPTESLSWKIFSVTSSKKKCKENNSCCAQSVI